MCTYVTIFTMPELLLRGSYEPTQVTNSKVKLYRSKEILTVPYLHPQNMQHTLSLTASSTYSVVLSGIKGLVAQLAFVIRQSPIANVGAGVFQDIITTFDIQNANGESMLGHYSLHVDESQQLIYPEKYDNLFSSNSNFIVIPFSKNPSHSLKDGVNDGYQPFNGLKN